MAPTRRTAAKFILPEVYGYVEAEKGADAI